MPEVEFEANPCAGCAKSKEPKDVMYAMYASERGRKRVTRWMSGADIDTGSRAEGIKITGSSTICPPCAAEMLGVSLEGIRGFYPPESYNLHEKYKQGKGQG